MSRAKTFDETDALEAAMLAFWRNGYAATSMQTLEQATGLKRPSLYHAFGNKRALFNKALDRYLETVLAKALEAIAAAPTAARAVEAALSEAVQLHFAPGHPGGCMVVLSLLESRQHDADTRARLHRALARLRGGLQRRFERACAEGDMPPAADCSALADAIVAMTAGLIVLAKGDVSQPRLEATIALATAMVPISA